MPIAPLPEESGNAGGGGCVGACVGGADESGDCGKGVSLHGSTFMYVLWRW